MKKGKFIVIDGIDGTGKATQAALLVERLKKEGKKVKTIDFPRYYDNFFGKLIGEYLAGKYGDFIEVDPHIASVLYAADRFESAPVIRKWIEEGFIVVADRYVSANQIHQGAKIDSAAGRKEFLRWLDKMEYGVFQIPKPDIIVYLDLPIELSQKLLRNKLLSFKKRYNKGRKVDVAEDNLVHMNASRRSALGMIKKSNNWLKIDCDGGGIIQPREVIHERVWKAVASLVSSG